MMQLREAQQQLADIHQRHVPIVIKLSPDEPDESLTRMADTIASVGIDGIIVTNTTTAREAVIGMPYGLEEGGLSGRPLFVRSTDVLRIIKPVVGKDVLLIGVGGIDSPEAVNNKLEAGATLVQVYTGLIYQGPGLVKRLVDGVQD
jgi:dihydroorotate dehydrogenase